MTEFTESESYWSARYEASNTPWDAGAITTPLKDYIDQLENKQLRILIPGAGNAYEAEYMHRSGFTRVMVADISQHPLNGLKLRCPDFPEGHLLHTDFFDLEGPFDLILEQTFFCALPPFRRMDYVNKCHQLLVPGGKLAGVLFDAPLNRDHPPFGGDMKEYQDLFLSKFTPRVMERCYNSIPPRQGREIFLLLEKRTV